MRSQLEETYLAIGENQFTLSCPLPAGQPRKYLLKIYCEGCRLSIFHMKWTFNIASSLLAGDILITSAGCSKAEFMPIGGRTCLSDQKQRTSGAECQWNGMTQELGLLVEKSLGALLRSFLRPNSSTKHSKKKLLTQRNDYLCR
jgi:hypothetical protein